MRPCAGLFAVVLATAPLSAARAQSEGADFPQQETGELEVILEQLEQRSANGQVSQALRDFVEQLDTPDLKWIEDLLLNTGIEVAERDFSWQIGLRARGGGERCGGILISERYVLTAAHCLDKNSATAAGPVNRYQVNEIEAFEASDTFGERPVELDETWPIRIHESYKTGAPLYSFDAALVRLARPLTGATPAPVGRRAFRTGPAVTSGWGDHPSGATGTLRAVVVPVVDVSLCRDHLAPQRWDQLGPATICSVDETADACARDSGGPLVVGTRLKPQTIGVVSWGGSSGCGVTGPNDALLGAYTRASSIADWVLRETGDSSAVTNSSPGQLMNVVSIKSFMEGLER